MALTLNGKKSNIKLNDFTSVMAKKGLNEKAISNIFARFEKLIPLWFEFIDLSFISDNLKNEYKHLIKSQFNRLYL